MNDTSSDHWFRNEDPLTGSSEKYTWDDAQRFLERARAEYQQTQVYHLLKWVRMACEQNDRSLGELGTTEEELLMMEKEGYKAYADFFLKYLRAWNITIRVQIADVIDYVHVGLRHGQYELADIGTTENELDRFAYLGERRNDALRLLEQMRKAKEVNAKYKNPDGVRQFRALAVEANYTLSQLGTDEEILQSFI